MGERKRNSSGDYMRPAGGNDCAGAERTTLRARRTHAAEPSLSTAQRYDRTISFGLADQSADECPRAKPEPKDESPPAESQREESDGGGPAELDPVYLSNPVGAVNEYCMKNALTQAYEEELLSADSGNTLFSCTVIVDGERYPSGTGRNKRAAKRDACTIALKYLVPHKRAKLEAGLVAGGGGGSGGGLSDVAKRRKSRARKAELGAQGVVVKPPAAVGIQQHGTFGGIDAAKSSSSCSDVHMASTSSLTETCGAGEPAAEGQQEPKHRFDYDDVPLSPATIGVLTGAGIKHPTTILSEHCQKGKIALPEWVEGRGEVLEGGNDTTRPFTATIRIDGVIYPTLSGRSKKVAREKCALYALDALVTSGRLVLSATTLPAQAANTDAMAKKRLEAPTFDLRSNNRFQIMVSNIYSLIADFNKADPSILRAAKVCAGIVLFDENSDNGWVVSWGTGTRTITGQSLSMEGSVVNDSHAEILTRRGLLRFLYSQLDEYVDGRDTVFDRNSFGDNGKLKLRDGLRFHLYINTAPCGDGRVFVLANKCDTSYGVSNMSTHRPVMGDPRKHGILRSKIESGEGTIPVMECPPVQTWDGIVGGERLRTMSCSDKLLKWNVLGVQGALLSQFMEPIYLRSIVIGTLCHLGHLSRAMCCRVGGLDERIRPIASGAFHVNHALLVPATDAKQMQSRDIGKQSAVCLNWNYADQTVEYLDGGKGTVDNKSGDAAVSRLAKKSLYERFKMFCGRLQKAELAAGSYQESKDRCAAYKQVQRQMVDFCTQRQYGTWLGKPREEKMFQ